MTEYIQVVTSIASVEDAQKLARILLEARLAACIQIVGPVVSHYWWQGAIDQAAEHLLFIKTSNSLYDEVEKTIKQNHPYEVAEILAMPILAGSSDYLSWMGRELKQ